MISLHVLLISWSTPQIYVVVFFRMKALADVLDLPTVRFKKLYDIRWLSLGQAVEAVAHNYPVLMTLLSNLAAETDDALVFGLYHKLRQYRVIATLHFLADAIKVTNHLSLIFQYRDVNFGSIPRHVSNKDSITLGFSLATISIP